MTISRRQFVRAAGAGAALTGLGLPGFVRAQATENLRIYTGFAPGGTSDTLCRRVADRLRTNGYAKAASVENRTGAGGQIAMTALKSSPPDGTVIAQTPASIMVIYPHTYKSLQYDPVNDFVPVSLGCTFEMGFAVGPAVPASIKSIPEFLAWCKQNPSSANFGSPAAGSQPHFIGTLIGRSGGVDLKHVAYRGTQPAIQDMVGGQIQAVSGPVGEFTQMVAAGRARLLATSGEKRSRFAPNTPTLVEQGLKDMVFSEWFGFFLPAKTPNDVVMRTNAALRAAIASQEVVDGIAIMGLEAVSSTPQELAALMKKDTERWGPIVKSIGFTAD
jgi:tripartite-type tricarboxylate transporter receptor subunit TctC